MSIVPQFDRWEGLFFPESDGIDHVEFLAPDGSSRQRPVFRHQPARLDYDDHGYEQVVADGAVVLAVRFTPDQPGAWQWRALKGSAQVAEGAFVCEASPHPGYVEVSPHDSRYFRYSTGTPCPALGLNLCMPETFALPAGGEFKQSGQRGTMGGNEYERWFSKLSAVGGNFTRLWVSGAYFNVDGDNAGELNLLQFARLDMVVRLARKYGIRLKPCLEHFRAVTPDYKPAVFCKVVRNPADGRQPKDMTEWLQDPLWRGLWLKKVDALTARYGDDPVIFAWELWNEMNCCHKTEWPVVREWTRDMLRELKTRSPRNLAVNSLGSFDWESCVAPYNDFKMDEMDFQQVHRYLDQGAGLPICRTDPVAFSIDAVNQARRPDRPVLLAETGAVNDCHTGPFRFYRWDDDGLIFHDTTYPAFFAGAAGCGQQWFWDHYVDEKKLWGGFQALSDLLHSVGLDREKFEPLDLSTPQAWVLALRGRTRILAWVRNKSDNWDRILRDRKQAAPVESLAIDPKSFGAVREKVEIFQPWPGDTQAMPQWQEGKLVLPSFTHGLVFRLERDV